MKCSVCGFESTETKFSVCPCCGNKTSSIVITETEIIKTDELNQFIIDKKNKDSYIGKDIQFEDVKLPAGFNKDFIQKEYDCFTINTNSGGEFFPNKEMAKIIVTIFVSFILVCSSADKLPEDKHFLILFYFIFLAVLAYVWTKFTNIKTKFKFSFEGINIHSRKGSLFIPKENIKDIYIDAYEITNENDNHKHMHYSIIFEFYQPIYIPYTKTNKYKVDFLSSFLNEEGRIIVCYIVQEIKKALCIN